MWKSQFDNVIVRQTHHLKNSLKSNKLNRVQRKDRESQGIKIYTKQRSWPILLDLPISEFYLQVAGIRCPDFPSTSRFEIVGDATTARMPSCLHRHFGLLNNYVVIYSCSWGCRTSSLVKKIARWQKLSHVDKQQVVGGGPHASGTRPNVDIIVLVMIISGTVV